MPADMTTETPAHWGVRVPETRRIVPCATETCARTLADARTGLTLVARGEHDDAWAEVDRG